MSKRDPGAIARYWELPSIVSISTPHVAYGLRNRLPWAGQTRQTFADCSELAPRGSRVYRFLRLPENHVRNSGGKIFQQTDLVC